MLWEEYYDKLGDWATSTAVSRLSKLESLGPPDEIIDAINQIAFEDEKGATRLLKKAVAAGVQFTGDQLSELFLICDEAVINQAIQNSAAGFRADDLDALYGFCDEEALVEIAKKQNVTLPESLGDYAEDFEETPEETEPAVTKEELAAEYDYILERLEQAHGLLQKAYRFSLTDTRRRKRGATVQKYACISEAQTHIAAALDAWNLLDIPDGDRQSLQGIWPNISNSIMWQNFLLEGWITNLMVQGRIRRVINNIAEAHKKIRLLRNSL